MGVGLYGLVIFALYGKESIRVTDNEVKRQFPDIKKSN